MENHNSFKSVAASKTTEMVAQILRGEAVAPVENPTPTEKTHQDILREVEKTYREILQPEAPAPEQP